MSWLVDSLVVSVNLFISYMVGLSLERMKLAGLSHGLSNKSENQ